ncbi:MAG TPA: hypothetical protein VGD66_07685 [Allosphingosinicella sp.]
MAVTAALLSVLSLPLLLPAAAVSPLALQGKGLNDAAVYVFFLSPLLLLVTVIGAFLTWRRYSHARLAVTLVPFVAVVAAGAFLRFS